MDNAHLKVEIVLNEGENEDEKRFNEIICYDSDGDSSQENEQIEPVGMVNYETVAQNVPSNQQFDSTTTNHEQKPDFKRSKNAEWRKYKAKQRVIQQNLKPNQQYDSASLKDSENQQTIPENFQPNQQYDSATLTHNENNQIVQENLQPHQQNVSSTLTRRSNAAQMRKYRAKQRSDPVKYQQYLERERIRNYKRKYEKRIEAAQQRAIDLGIPYIVLEPEGHIRRGRKPKFASSDVTLVLPAKYEDESMDESNSFNSDDMPMIPVKVELQESDEIYQEQKPSISVVNINKLMKNPRTALQTLLPQEVNDRERVTNFIQLEHDYVKTGANKMDPHKLELLKLQEQCRNFVLNKAFTASGSTKSKRTRRFNNTSTRKPTSEFVHIDCAEHEDLDDLFKELSAVANKEPKKIHSSKRSPRSLHKQSPRKQSPHSSKTSPRSLKTLPRSSKTSSRSTKASPRSSKTSPRKRSPRKKSPFKQLPREVDGQFSLTVSMPVHPLIAPKKAAHSTNPFDISRIKGSYMPKSSGMPSDMLLFKKNVSSESGVFDCNEDSIEIKQEPIDLDDIKQEPVNSDDNLF